MILFCTTLKWCGEWLVILCHHMQQVHHSEVCHKDYWSSVWWVPKAKQSVAADQQSSVQKRLIKTFSFVTMYLTFFTLILVYPYPFYILAKVLTLQQLFFYQKMMLVLVWLVNLLFSLVLSNCIYIFTKENISLH